ncbi:iron complex transport system ATP-binding protein [Catalinimonas alkaloidigena]|uniref:ABC transporter ATP-binding protein n=1 Tax=Catalinimonas alkaloidigena TaxID=1075417 RepID=UPI0024074C1E|nr:ABC transporter ATP-binding protein [Catalinimonas alkaloidigena]MDF9795256.1 iron complex transport system ATP-binding protein [Catalinimonas alkaloidigena]
MQNENTILFTRGLSVGYSPDKLLISKLDLKVKRGELICLLGTNGAGKSTLLRTLAGMQAALEGEVSIAGKLLSEISPRRLAQQLSLVLTERGIALNLRVHELIAMGRHPYSGWFGRLSQVDRKLIDQAMEDTATLEFANRPFYELSDGEKQKVMIARALAQDTPLIILDEPTVHLDLPNRVEIMQLLHRLTHEKQKAILMSSHDLELVIQSADQLWLLHKQNIWSGIPEDLVLQGKVEACFQSKNLRFDQQKGSFVIRRKPTLPIRLNGEGILTHWTQQALERVGYKIVENADTKLSVQIQQTSPTPTWIIQGQGNSIMCRSLSALLSKLKDKRYYVSRELRDKE